MMTIDQILTKLDHYYKEDQLTEVEPFLLSCLEDAKKEQEYGIYISVGNELLGFYRSIGQFEAAFAVGEDVLLLMEELQLDHTVHFATTLFNVATAYRTAGKYEEALANYRRALEIYQKELPKDDYRLAELYSRHSILLKMLQRNENRRCFWEKRFRLWKNSLEQGLKWLTSRTSLALIELKMDKWKRRKSISSLRFPRLKRMAVRRIHTTAQRLPDSARSATVRAVWNAPWKIMSTRCLRWKSILAEKKATVCSAATARRSAESLDRAQKLKSMRCSAKNTARKPDRTGK